MPQIAKLDDAELDELERLIEVPERRSLCLGDRRRRPSPARYDTAAVRRRLKSRFQSRRGATSDDAREDRRRDRRRNVWRPAGRCCSPASPTAPKGWCSPIWRARSRRGRGRAGDQPCGDLPRRPAHGGAGARAGILRARHRGAGVPGLGLPALRPGVAACAASWRSA